MHATTKPLAAVQHATACLQCTLTCVQVWVKPSSEMSFLYGNHVLKSGLAKITENTPTNAGVVVFSLTDTPLGFGVAAKSTADCRTADPGTIVALHQGDVGEYLRSEDDLL
jgi:60S ribosome subunit biogenesis protein NIP7